MDPYDLEDLSQNQGAEIDHNIDRIYPNKKSIAYGLYFKLISYENHYNLIQTKYKALATTWMLAAFIGIGYLLGGKETGIPFNILISTMLICLLAAEGIILVWFLDAGVYYRLIEAIFAEAIKLETRFKFLGKNHQNLLRLHNSHRDPLKFMTMFYSSFVFFLLLIALISIALYVYSINILYLYVLAFFLFASSLIFWALYNIKRKHRRKS